MSEHCNVDIKSVVSQLNELSETRSYLRAKELRRQIEEQIDILVRESRNELGLQKEPAPSGDPKSSSFLKNDI